MFEEWRKEMGLPETKIYNIVVTRPDNQKFVFNTKNDREDGVAAMKVMKKIWKLFEGSHDLLLRISRKNSDTQFEFIIKMNEDDEILRQINTRINSLIKSSGLNIVLEEKDREYLYSELFYKRPNTRNLFN